MGSTRGVVFLLIGLMLVVPAPAFGEGVQATDGLTAPGPVEVKGLVEARADSGALLLGSEDGVAAAWLRAERLVIEHAWERGVNMGSGDSLFRYVREAGSESIVLEGATVSFEPFDDSPILLAHSERLEASFEVRSAGTVSFAPERGSWWVQSGSAPDSMGAMETPELGHWYAVGGPGARGHTSGSYSLLGTFSLFIEDVVVHAIGQDHAWKEWTGYREDGPDAPASEYEYRVTTITVENGALEGVSIDAFAFYAPQVETGLRGTVSGQGISGLLRHAGELYVFDGDPLQAEGTGVLSLGGEWDGSGSRQEARLRVGLEGDLKVMGARSVAPDPSRAQPDEGRLLTWVSFSALALLGTGGLMVLGIVPGPTPRSRRRRHRRWMEKGEQAGVVEDWPRAVHCFHRAVRLRRNDPFAWFRLAECTLEGGDPEMAETVSAQAAEIPGMDPADLLDLRAMAAWERGDKEAFEVFLRALERVSPPMASGLRADLGLREAPPRVSSARGRNGHPQEEGMDGYA